MSKVGRVACLAGSVFLALCAAPRRTARAGSPIHIACDGATAGTLAAQIRSAGATPVSLVIDPDPAAGKACVVTFSGYDFGTSSTPPSTIYGPTALPPVTGDVTIDGQGATLVIASSSYARFFYVAGGESVTSGAITLPTGRSSGSLTLRNLTLQDGHLTGGAGGKGQFAGGGGAAMGGSIYSDGALSLDSVTIVGSRAGGGSGGNVDTGALNASGGGGGMGGAGGDGGNETGGGGGGMGRDGATSTFGSGGGGGIGGAGAVGTPSGSTGIGGGGGGLYRDGSGASGGDSTGGNGSSSAGGAARGAGGGGAGGGGGGATAPQPGGAGKFGGGGGGGSTAGAGGTGGGGGGGAGTGFSAYTGGLGGWGAGSGGGACGSSYGGGGGGYSTSLCALPKWGAFGGAGGMSVSIGQLPGGGGGAALGGALFIGNGTAALLNVTIANAQVIGGAGGSGGSTASGGFGGTGTGSAIFVHNGKVTIDSTTISGGLARGGLDPHRSTAPKGATLGIDGGQLSIANSIVTNADTDVDCSLSGTATIAASGAVLVGDTSGSCWSGKAGVVAAGVLSLGALADNAGPVQTEALTTSSTAYGKGDCTATAAAGLTIANDARGFVRPNPKACDVGAFELTRLLSVSISGTGSGSVTDDAGRLTCSTGTCSARYKPTTAISLSAAPSAGSTFSGFAGGLSGTTTPQLIAAGSSDVAVSASFAASASPDAGSDAADASAPEASLPEAGSTPVIKGTFVSCKADSECGGKTCVEGVCCDRACTGSCESCRVPTSPGVCTLVPYGTDPKSACGAKGTCSQTCNGAGSCVPAVAGVECAPSACTDATHGTGISVCSAAGGSCATLSSATFDCAPYICDGNFGACKTSCVTTADCANGGTCDGTGHCVPGANGGASGCAIGARRNESSTRWGFFLGAMATAWIARRRKGARRSRIGCRSDETATPLLLVGLSREYRLQRFS